MRILHRAGFIFKAIPHNSKCRYGERGAAAAKPKAQIILDAAKVSAASGGCGEPKQGAVAECEGLLPPKHDAGTATRHYRAFWQRRCRAAAAGAVLKPSGGNCAVLPLFIIIYYLGEIVCNNWSPCTGPTALFFPLIPRPQPHSKASRCPAPAASRLPPQRRPAHTQ